MLDAVFSHSEICLRVLKCHNNDMCVQRSRICNKGLADCPLADDERFCEQINCPQTCECDGALTYFCGHLTEQEFYTLPISTRALSFQLHLSFTVEQLWQALSIHHFHYLRSFTLYGANVGVLPSGIFSQHHHLLFLNLSGNHINSIHHSIFSDKRTIQHISLQDNPLQDVNIDQLVINTSPVTFLDAPLPGDSCCSATDLIQTNCLLYISILSCTQSLPFVNFTFYVTLEGGLLLVLNTVMLWMCKASKTKCQLRNIIVVHLALAGYTMGIHLFVLGIQQLNARHNEHELDWGSQFPCHLFAILATLSTLLTAMATILIVIYQLVGTR